MMKLTGKLSRPAAVAADSQASPRSSNNRREQFGSLGSVGGTAESRPRPDVPPFLVAASHCQSIAGSTLTGPEDTTSTVNGGLVKDTQSPGYSGTGRRTTTEDDCDSGMLWSDDPEKEYFQYILRQEQEVRAQQGKSAQGSLLGDRTIDEIQNQQQQEPSVLFEGYSLASTEFSRGIQLHEKPVHAGNVYSTTQLRNLLPSQVETPTNIVSPMPNNIIFLPDAPTTIDSREQQDQDDGPPKGGVTTRKGRYFYILIILLTVVCLMLVCVIGAILLSAIHLSSTPTATSGDAILGNIPTTTTSNNVSIPTASPSRLTSPPVGVSGPTLMTLTPMDTSTFAHPSLRPSRDAGPPTAAPSDNSIATNISGGHTSSSIRETYCGCRNCTAFELTDSGIDCVVRINYLITAVDWSEEQACRQISGKEYPEECSELKCNPDVCDQEIVMVEEELLVASPSPTSAPDLDPTTPTSRPTLHPVLTPSPTTSRPTVHPTTATPTTRMPSRPPTDRPTVHPNTDQPTKIPTTGLPTRAPTKSPVTAQPTQQPTRRPTHPPTASPATARPTEQPTRRPTHAPTESPTARPTQQPTRRPTHAPTERPVTARPTEQPTRRPTRSYHAPTESPIVHPFTARPTQQPSRRPTSSSILAANRLDLRLAYKFPLRRCEGDCDSDDDCQQGLVCFQRESGDLIPGCIIGGNEDALEETKTDFCVPTLRPASAANQLDLRFGLSFPLNRCEGDCDTDNDCQQGLFCFQRERGGPIPGCLLGGNPDLLEETRTDFCVPEDDP